MGEETGKKKPSNDTYEAVAERMLGIKERYNDIPIDAVFSAWMAAGGMGFLRNWPSVQNARIKAYNTLPEDISKDQIAEMVVDPGRHEKKLRAVSTALTGSAKTYDLIIQTYQDILTYDWYVYPAYTPKDEGIEARKRDLLMAQKIVETMNVKEKAHEMVGLAIQYGKVFYTPRISVDRSHGTVHHAFFQQLPEDWCKIVGYNNGPGKYTVAFDMMYFMRPGTDPYQFGELFEPYLDMFYRVVERPEKKAGYIFSSYGPRVNAEKFKAYRAAESAGSPEWMQVGTQHMYWVTLPAEKVFVAEANDRSVNVAPALTGLMVSMVQIPDYEAAQMQIVLNPLTSIMTGELETYSNNSVPNADPVVVSPAQRQLFEYFWYNMLDRNNTSGIGLYLAPAKNLKLQTISDTVSNTNIATTAVADQIQKAGLSALLPTTNDPKVGIAQISAAINARYPQTIYRALERFYNWLFEDLGFRTTIRFKMFGDIFSREAEMKAAKDGMTLGILPDTLKYEAMQGLTLLDDLAISDFVKKSGILDKRLPLVSSYSAKQGDGTLPPQAKKELNPGGRPPEEGSENGEKTEPALEGQA